MNTVYARISDNGNCNTFGNINVDGVRRLWSGRYQARIARDSVNKPLGWSDDYKTNVDKEYWFYFQKSKPLFVCDNARLPKVEKGESVYWSEKLNHWNEKF